MHDGRGNRNGFFAKTRVGFDLRVKPFRSAGQGRTERRNAPNAAPSNPETPPTSGRPSRKCGLCTARVARLRKTQESPPRCDARRAVRRSRSGLVVECRSRPWLAAPVATPAMSGSNPRCDGWGGRFGRPTTPRKAAGAGDAPQSGSGWPSGRASREPPPRRPSRGPSRTGRGPHRGESGGRVGRRGAAGRQGIESTVPPASRRGGPVGRSKPSRRSGPWSASYVQ